MLYLRTPTDQPVAASCRAGAGAALAKNKTPTPSPPRPSPPRPAKYTTVALALATKKLGTLEAAIRVGGRQTFLGGGTPLHLSLPALALHSQALGLGPFFAGNGQALTLFAPTGELRLAQRGCAAAALT